jgi:malonate transporter
MREMVRNPLIIATASGLVANLLGFNIPDCGWSPRSRASARHRIALG